MSTPSVSQVAFRPWPSEDPNADNAQALLRQIYVERGHFRGITEESLQDEIATAKDDADNIMEDVEGVEKEEEQVAQDEKQRRTEVIQARVKMEQLIANALNQSRFALDFISLMVSKDKPASAEVTMSPALKGAAPKGSLGYDKWPLTDVAPKLKRRQDLVAKGWRMKGLETAADSILKAATRLETEVRKETKYWEQVLSITDKGWSVRQLYRRGHRPVLGVQFGFSEASDYFKGRGLAPLRMNEHGGIILDAELTQRAKAVRVRVSENGKIVGCSRLPANTDTTELPIEDLIRRARDSLFEEEIYHEMSMETRQLLSYDVKLRESVIQIPAPRYSDESKTERHLLIDLVPLDDPPLGIQEHTYDWLAENVVVALRVLLSYEHRQRLHRRSQMPPPVTENPRPTPHPPLIRTLLTFFHNLEAVQSLRAYIDRTHRVLSSAGLDSELSLAYSPGLSDLVSNAKAAAPSDLSVCDKVISLLTRPLSSTITVRLPSTSANSKPREEMVLATRTYIGQPWHGTEFKLTLSPSIASVLFAEKNPKQDMQFHSTTEVTSYIDLLISLDLSHLVILKEHAGWVGGHRLPRVMKAAAKQKKQISKTLEVVVEDGLMQVSLRTSDSETVKDYLWDGSDGKESFREVIRGFVGAH